MVIVKRFWKDGIGMSNTASLCQILGLTEEQIKQYDALALEDHSYVATPEERSRKIIPGRFL